MSAKLFFFPFIPVFTSRGLPAGGATVAFYYTGTTTLAPVYADAAFTTPLTNPVPADGLGKLPDLYLDDTIIYRVRVLDGLGNAIQADVDPYLPGTQIFPTGPAGPAFATFTTLATFKAAPITNKTQVLQDPSIPFGVFFWSTANAPYTADNVNVIKADSTPLSVGAWVRYSASAYYAPIAGEIGAINFQYDVGDSRRYGVFPDGVTNWEVATNYMTNILRTAAAGFTIKFKKNGTDRFYKTGFNTTNRYGFTGMSFEFEDGVEFGGILHLISSGTPVSRLVPTGVNVGATTTITVSGGHGMAVGDDRYVRFAGMSMAALDGKDLLTTILNSTQFTVPANTTGQVWSGAGDFRDTPLQNVVVRGTFTTYDRFGAINAQNVSVDRIVCKSNAAKNVNGTQGRGVHIYFGCANWNVGEMLVEDIGPQSENPTNHAAIAIDGDKVEPDNINVGMMTVIDSQVSGVVLKGTVNVASMDIQAYGRGTITVAPEGVSGNDPNGVPASNTAAAVWLVRGRGTIGQLKMNQSKGYATGRANASHGLVVERDFLQWTSNSVFVETQNGWRIEHIEGGNLKQATVSVGAFGQAATLTVGQTDLSPISATNDMITDAGIQTTTGMVWAVNGVLNIDTLVVGDCGAAQAVKEESNSTVSVQINYVDVYGHANRALWLRSNGSIGRIVIRDRVIPSGAANPLASIDVSGSAAVNFALGRVFARNVAVVARPLLNFAPARGRIDDIVSENYAPTTAGIGAVTLGSNSAENLILQAATITKSGGASGNGLALNGLADSYTSNIRVQGFANGVIVPNLNTRLASIKCISTGNTTSTALTNAEMAVGAANAMGNIGWSV